jgi:hypothetical protein
MKPHICKQRKSFSPFTSSPNYSQNAEPSDYLSNDGNPISLERSMVTVQSKKSNMLYNTFYYQVRGKKVLRYSSSEFRSSKQKEFVNVLNNSEKATYRGKMSTASANNLRKKIMIWHDATLFHNTERNHVTVGDNRRLVFVTLTLSSTQIHSDKEIKLLILKPFFRILRDQADICNYVWKAERQGNGNIHFHCIVDRYIDKKKLQMWWNKCQNHLGYIDEFEKKHGHTSPPSTDVRMVVDAGMLSEYLEKYVCKEDVNGTIEGSVWKASKGLLSLHFFEFVSDSVVDSNFERAVEQGLISQHDEERYTVFDLKQVEVESLLTPLHIAQYDVYKNFLLLFLFFNPIVSDFRTYCFLLSEQGGTIKDEKPIICSKKYPENIQLSIDEFLKFAKIKGRGL